jgi:hypothetical protein
MNRPHTLQLNHYKSTVEALQLILLKTTYMDHGTFDSSMLTHTNLEQPLCDILITKTTVKNVHDMPRKGLKSKEYM